VEHSLISLPLPFPRATSILAGVTWLEMMILAKLEMVAYLHVEVMEQMIDDDNNQIKRVV